MLSEQLSQCGFTITSGTACGIDGVAHHAALSAKGEVSLCLAMVFLVSIRVVITFWLSNLSLQRGDSV